jgi:hypothetical protein
VVVIVLLLLIGTSCHPLPVLKCVCAIAAVLLDLFAFPVSIRGELNANVARSRIKSKGSGPFAPQLVVVLRHPCLFLLQFSDLALELLYLGLQRTDSLVLLLGITVIAVHEKEK